jgi:hypothetical protein
MITRFRNLVVLLDSVENLPLPPTDVNDHSRIDPIHTPLQRKRTQPFAIRKPPALLPEEARQNLCLHKLLYSYFCPSPLSAFSSCLQPFQLTPILSTLLPDMSGQEGYTYFPMRQRHSLECCLTSGFGNCTTRCYARVFHRHIGLRHVDFY